MNKYGRSVGITLAEYGCLGFRVLHRVFSNDNRDVMTKEKVSD